MRFGVRFGAGLLRLRFPGRLPLGLFGPFGFRQLFPARLLFQVIFVIALVILDSAILDFPDAVHNLVDEVAVMADDEHRAVENLQSRFHRLLGQDVQMVRRFIEDQEIGTVHYELQQHKARFLSARQCTNLLIDIVAVEHHAPQEGPCLFVRQPVFGQEIVKDGLFGIQPFVTLGEIADPDAVADLRFPSQGLHLAQDGAQQRRLAAAVGPDEADLLAPAQDQAGILDEHLVAVSRTQAVQDEDAFGALRGFRQPQGEGFIFHRFFQAFQPVQARLASPGHLTLDARLEAADIGLLLGDVVLLGLIGRLFGLDLDFLFHQILGVVARERLQAAALHFEDARRHVVQEGTVMADHEQAAAEIVQVLLQPFHHADVQMVRRFVKNEEFRRTHEGRRQHKARLLAAGQAFRRLLPHGFRKGQAEEDLLQVRLVVVPVQILVALRCPGIGVEHLLVPRRGGLFQLRQFSPQLQDFRVGMEQEVPKGLRPEAVETLFHIPCLQPCLKSDGAAVGVIRIQQAFEQRRLAAAVDAHQPDMFALGHSETDIFEDFVRAEGFC